MKKLIIIPALFVTLIIGLMYITGTHDTPTMEKPVQQGCGGDSVSCDETIVIPDSHEAAEKYISRKTVVDNKLHITMFYSYDCPHCKDALVFFEKLVNVDPQSADEQYGNEIKKYMDNSDKNIKIVVDAYEIKQNINNRKIFKNFADDYDTELKGVPMIFIGEKSLVGFSKDSTPGELINEILFLENKGSPAAGVYKIPFLGKVTADSISLPYFTVVLGLLDGFNPCAMWVLLFLLGILVHAGSREKVFFIGIIFVLTSGAVYFAFMTAWLNLFLIIGFSRVVTIILASAAIFMGLINLKEI